MQISFILSLLRILLSLFPFQAIVFNNIFHMIFINISLKNIIFTVHIYFTMQEFIILLREDICIMKESSINILPGASIFLCPVLKYIWGKKLISTLDSSLHHLRFPLESYGYCCFILFYIEKVLPYFFLVVTLILTFWTCASNLNIFHRKVF